MKGRTMMAEIKKYTKKDGSTAYMFNTYLGVDPKTGKTKRTTRRGFKTKKEANQALARIELGVDEPKPKTQKKYTTFEDIYKTWFDYYVYTVKETTALNTQTYFNKHILPIFGKQLIDQITFEDCQKAVIQWSKNSVVFPVYKSYTEQVFEYAIKKHIIDSNPMDFVIMPKRPKRKKANNDFYYTQTELDEFLSWMKKNQPKKHYTAMRVLAYTGLRRGELAALTWSDIDFKNATLNVDKGIVRIYHGTKLSSTKSESAVRKISLDQKTLNVLRSWKLEQRKIFFKLGLSVNSDEQQLIITNRENVHISPSYFLWVMKRYPGKRLTPHGLRHTHATLLLNAGVLLPDVQYRLGHAQSSTTLNVYTHHSKDDSYVADILSNINGNQTSIQSL